MNTQTTIISRDEEVKDLIAGLAKRQYARHGIVNLSEIQERVFGRKGGHFHEFVSEEVDKLGIPRRKSPRKQRTVCAEKTNTATVKTFSFAPAVVTLDPQGVTESAQ